MAPERDVWFKCELIRGAPPTMVILHVHYLGPWDELDESRIAQVNARFSSSVGAYQYESHPDIQTGIMPQGYVVTAIKGYDKKNNDPTGWMGGGPNQPPPWVWRDDPDRSNVGAILLTKGKGPGAQAVPFEYSDALRRRFRDVHDALDLALSALSSAQTAMISVDAVSQMDPEARPFASQFYWAGFTVTGWGGLPFVKMPSKVVQAMYE